MKRLALIAVFAIGRMTFVPAAEIPLVDKTLVAWVAPANLSQRGGSVLTIEDKSGRFDAIVFGELVPQRWMAGSDLFRRTLPARDQDALSAETADADTLVQIAVVNRGPEVIVYRNGAEYSRHKITQPQVFDDQCFVVIGPRHLERAEFFAGEVDDARIYASALSAEQIAALQPNVEGEFQPWAWWSFDDAATVDRTGRFPHARLSGGAEARNGRLVLNGSGATFSASRRPLGESNSVALNFHLTHPGGDSLPGDPNAAFYLDGVYHLHYILAHPWRGRQSFSFVHVTSPDMLHWTWQSTKLQPSFTGHGMFSGTGFITKEGRPAVIYHGESSGRNQIAIAKDNRLSAWEKPYPVVAKNADGSEAVMNHWDPDCFLIGDSYYAISGGENPPLLKSKDLKTWTRVGSFLSRDLPDVAVGEDISCANFFRLGDKWMLLCISHDLGCRYYIGDWDEKAEQFAPERHGRMNWRREEQSLFGRGSWRVDFFAPESVLTPDGRRVMWAWLATLDKSDGAMSGKTIQSLPRELSLGDDGNLRIQPLRELESLRYDLIVLTDIQLNEMASEPRADRLPAGKTIAEVDRDGMEIRVTVARDQAERKRFGFMLFADGKGGGLPIVFRPETGALRVGSSEAPFSVADLPAGEELDLQIYIDRFVVEVFVNGRQAMVAAHLDDTGGASINAFTAGAPTTIKKVEMWKIRPTNAGFLAAQKNRVWEPETK